VRPNRTAPLYPSAYRRHHQITAKGRRTDRRQPHISPLR
jgi:hypothetical protein